MASNMQYYVRTTDGKEYGPAEQDVLIQWAKAGRITSSCQVRNALVHKWAPALKIPFLKSVVRNEEEEAKKKRLIPESHDQVDLGFSLNRRGKYRYVPASVGMRFGAWVMDMLIVGAAALLLLAFGWSMIENGAVRDGVWMLVSIGILALYLLYYVVAMGLRAQTVGQWFWGIMATRPDGRPVLMGRACWFAVLELLFFWSTLLFVFVLPSKRGIQDMLSGVAISRITVREIAAASV